MRVTKAVRSYIEKQVEIKVAQKYEWEKEEAQRIREVKDNLIERARDAALLAATAILREASNHPDILIYRPEVEEKIYIGGVDSAIYIKDICYSSSVHGWRNRMNKEVDEIVENIVVTLELGGNKADLDRMLAEL